MTFEEWMDKVNEYIAGIVGLSSDDLPDCSYYDWFADGYSPRQAARMALKNAW